MKLYIATYKTGEHQGKHWKEYDSVRIVSILAENTDAARTKAIIYLGLKPEDAAGVSVV